MRASFHCLTNIFMVLAAFWLMAVNFSQAAELVTFESESGTPGTNFATGNASSVIYISCTSNNTSLTVPALSSRVASYSVTFPAPGTYDLYARIRVGIGGANDDSFFTATDSASSRRPQAQIGSYATTWRTWDS